MKFLIVLACIAAASAAPLSHDEAELLKGLWDQIRHNEVDILAAVFKAHPDIQARFPKFAGKELDSIKGSADFAIHASRIVSFISEVVSLSGNEATLPAIQSIVTKLGHDHKSRGISKEQFNDFRSALTDYASSHAAWNDNVAAAWNHAIDNIYAIVFAALEH